MNSEENNEVVTNEENNEMTNVVQTSVSEVVQDEVPIGEVETPSEIQQVEEQPVEFPQENIEVTTEPTPEVVVEQPMETPSQPQQFEEQPVMVSQENVEVTAEPTPEVVLEQPVETPNDVQQVEEQPVLEPTIEDIPDNNQTIQNVESVQTNTTSSIDETQEIEKLDPTQKIATAEEIQEAINTTSVQPNGGKQKGGPNGFKRFMAVILFLGFFALVFFMPEVTRFINEWRASNQPVQKITDGISTCTLTKTTKNFDVDITTIFTITNSKLRKLSYVTESKGNAEEDKEELNKLKDECLVLKQEAGELKGVSIKCNLDGGVVTNRQILDYELMDVKQVTTAYTEAGGIYPEFTKGEDIDKIEGKMQQAGYKCTRK